ncbi:unnamed protein product [Didymodactylos carnosus]|uniref:Uncharacterized protein n=1 Tax=Didymodactylos carnosus TaxID=1234261 RepID=A0A8S2FBR8_9BILA|nr:unnamed protein product [Didymodactylos carnosus]CAF4218273.1 unnamed protein product [Didymodactylos carnosus]
MSNDVAKCDLQLLCENLSKANSFYESTVIRMLSMTLSDNVLLSSRAHMTLDDDTNSIFDFERSYCDIRSSIIQQFYLLIHTLNNFDLGLISLDLMGKRMLSIISKRLNTIGSKINDIVQSCFDVDSQTLWCRNTSDNNKKTKKLDEEISILQYLASTLITSPPPLPRMFFQKLQKNNH